MLSLPSLVLWSFFKDCLHVWLHLVPMFEVSLNWFWTMFLFLTCYFQFSDWPGNVPIEQQLLVSWLPPQPFPNVLPTRFECLIVYGWSIANSPDKRTIGGRIQHCCFGILYFPLRFSSAIIHAHRQHEGCAHVYFYIRSFETLQWGSPPLW